MPRRSAARREAAIGGGRGRPAPCFLLDQFIDLVLLERPVERRRWVEAHAREWYRRLPRHSTPAGRTRRGVSRVSATLDRRVRGISGRTRADGATASSG
jgi:hypothetical protein